MNFLNNAHQFDQGPGGYKKMSRTGSKTKLKGKAAAKESPATDPEVSYAVYWDLRPLFGQFTIGCHRNQILKG